MGSPNTSLLQAATGTPSDKTPGALAVSSSRISFAFQGVQPPSILYVDVDDNIVISAASNQGGETVTVNVRMLLPDGRIEDMQYLVSPASTRAVSSTRQRLAQGYIISISALALVANTRGQTFARISIQRSASGSGQPAQMLFADYVTTLATSAYPNGRVLAPTEGPGWIHGTAQSPPAAGADFVFNSANNQRIKIRSVLIPFVASAAVANRQVEIEILHNTNIVMRLSAPANITAGQTAFVNLLPLDPYVGILTNDFIIPIPLELAFGGFTGGVGTLQSVTTGIQAGDQWGSLNMLVEEWLENV